MVSKDWRLPGALFAWYALSHAAQIGAQLYLGEGMAEIVKSTAENWQSEALQLFTQFVLPLVLVSKYGNVNRQDLEQALDAHAATVGRISVAHHDATRITIGSTVRDVVRSELDSAYRTLAERIERVGVELGNERDRIMAAFREELLTLDGQIGTLDRHVREATASRIERLDPKERDEILAQMKADIVRGRDPVCIISAIVDELDRRAASKAREASE